MVREARLEDAGSGLAPVTDGWFVVNAHDAAWLVQPEFGARCVFEAGTPVLRRRPDLEVRQFEQLGITLAVVAPGRPGGLYHAESLQEDFLVLTGECVLVIEEEERRLRAWDFVHCPPGTNHVFVGASAGPCVILMVGRRSEERTIRYPRADAALRHGAGVEEETDSPRAAYADRPHWQPQRPADDALFTLGGGSASRPR
jgi:uncharacterized cupin superfamily protein